MTDHPSERLAAAFEEHRPHLHALAYRLLGATGEAEDAVQESWMSHQPSRTLKASGRGNDEGSSRHLHRLGNSQ